LNANVKPKEKGSGMLIGCKSKDGGKNKGIG
jgi:hypothetical protein